MKKITLLFGALTLLLVLGTSCDENNDSNPDVYVNLIITDAPTLGDFAEVNLSFSGVKFITDLGNYSTKDLESSAYYNFLDFLNGNDSMLMSMPVKYGDTLSQIHFTAGSVNELVTSSGQKITMDASVAQDYGVYLPVLNYSSSYPGDDYDVVLDINLHKSIQQEDGSYYFRPQGRCYLLQGTSYIEGWVQPSTTSFIVSTVTPQNDTLTTISDPSNNNYFRLSGLPADTYKIEFENQYSDGTYTQSVTLSDENLSMGNVATGL